MQMGCYSGGAHTKGAPLVAWKEDQSDPYQLPITSSGQSVSTIQEHDDARLLPDKRLNKNPTHQQSKRCNSNDFQEVECRLVDTISSYIIFDAGISWFLHSLDSCFKFYIFQQASVSTIVKFFFNSELLAFFDTSPIAVFKFFDQSQSFKLANTEKNSSMIFLK